MYRKKNKTGRILEYIDPNLSDKPAQLEYLTKLILTSLENNAVNPTDLKIYKLAFIKYKIELSKYKPQEKTFRDLKAFIQNIIAGNNAFFIQHNDYL